jgi:hypothetical protein
LMLRTPEPSCQHPMSWHDRTRGILSETARAYRPWLLEE